MAVSVNKVILIGHVGRDPDVREVQSGCIANLSVATSHRFTKNGESVEETEWHSVTAFGYQADFIRDYVTKGRLVYIEGRIRTRKWQDQSGEMNYRTEVICEQIKTLDSNKSGNGEDHQRSHQAQPQKSRGYNQTTTPAVEDEDIPF